MLNPAREDLPGSVTLLSVALREPVVASTLRHVLLVVDQFPRVLGGGERVVLRTAEMLQNAGFRVSLLTFAIEEGCRALDQAPCPVYLQPLTGVFKASAVKDALDLGRFLRREKVRIVETFFESSNLFGGIVTKALSDAKLVWSFRDMGILRDRKHRLAYRLLPWLPDHVFAVSEEVRRHAIEVDRLPPDRVTVLYNGIDLDRWPERSSTPVTEPAGMTVVTVGNLRKVKGHDVLLEAAAEVLQRFPEARFEVAGDVLEPEFFAQLQTRALELGIADRFVFLGGVSDLQALFATATLFVLPSRSEGFSNAILEAMAASLPVVATAVGGNAEAVDDACGVIVPDSDPHALADATIRILSEADCGRAMGAAGRRRVEKMFSLFSVQSEMVGIFCRILRQD